MERAVKCSSVIPAQSRKGGFLTASGWNPIHLVGKLVFSQLKALSGMSHMSFINKNEKNGVIITA